MTAAVTIGGEPVTVSPAGRRVLRDAATGTVLWGEMHPACRDRLVIAGLVVELPGRIVGVTRDGLEVLRQILHE